MEEAEVATRDSSSGSIELLTRDRRKGSVGDGHVVIMAFARPTTDIRRRSRIIFLCDGEVRRETV